MTALQQETDQSPQGLTTIAPVPHVPPAPRAGVQDGEVLALRQRVAELEAELAAIRSASAAKLPQPGSAPGVDAAPPCRPFEQAPAASSAGEFDEPQTAAVQTAAVQTAAVPRVVPNPGFAQAWHADTPDDENASFEEVFAERAFFDATSVDERSRNWLLDQ